VNWIIFFENHNFVMEDRESHFLVFDRFEERVCQIFRDLATDKDFCDVTLACENKQVQSHKIILSAVSPILSTLLKENPNQHPLIYLRGVKYDQLVCLMEFIYKGEVNIAQEDVEDFLEMANDLRIEGLSLKEDGEDEEEEEEPGDVTAELPVEAMQNNGRSTKRKRSETPESSQGSIGRQLQLVEPHHVKVESNDDMTHYDVDEDFAIEEEDTPGADWPFNHGVFPVSKTNTKTTSCEVCNRTFKSRQNLKQHIESVHQKVRYDCDQCDHRASTKSNLRCHKASQHEGIKYDCDECDYSATNKSRLKKHKDAKHETPLAVLLKKTEENFKQNYVFQ